jgi:DNA mismatch repair protein MutL
MARIERLPSDLANQIAAGEVVERPASVVKELLENALDAGATRIKVELENGGALLVRVVDDGEGMTADDAVLSLERHATSKIRSKEDLFTLRTFGFRGEALPSIASVSQLRLLTRGRGAPEATEVMVEGGGSTRVRPIGAPEGTTLEVRNLFYNVPARRKFLKAAPTEAAHVTEAVMLAALARHDVSFSSFATGERCASGSAFRRDASERCKHSRTRGSSPVWEAVVRCASRPISRRRARPGWGRGAPSSREWASGARPHARASRFAGIWVGSSSGPLSGRGRVYRSPPDQVDVNVHPRKAEVRFSDARALFDSVTRELHESLARAFSIPSQGLSRGWSPRPAMSGPSLLAGATSIAEFPGATDPWKLAPTQVTASAPDAANKEAAAETSLEPTLFEGGGFYGSLDFIAQVRSTFLVCAGSDGLYVLDQHAAAERVTFHRLRRSFAQRAIATQRLLLPEVVDLLPAEMAALDEHAADVAALGVELRAVGPKAVAVHAVPMLLARSRPERLVRDLVAELGRAAKRPFGDAADLVLATMACHGSIRAGDAVSREEAVALLLALDGIDFAGHCPHGRPVVTRIGYDDLERRVGR